MSSSAGQAAEPSLSLHPRVALAGLVCLCAAALGALSGDPLAGALGAAAVAIPVAGMGLTLRRIGRQRAALMAAVALAAPCVRLSLSTTLAIGLWLAEPMSSAGFWGAFVGAALGTLAVETLGFAADFRALERDTTEAALA